MSKGSFGAGFIGFILGLLTCGLYTLFKRNKSEKQLTIFHHDD